MRPDAPAEQQAEIELDVLGPVLRQAAHRCSLRHAEVVEGVGEALGAIDAFGKRQRTRAVLDPAGGGVLTAARRMR